MANITKVEFKPQIKKIVRVAAYARVSDEKWAMHKSLAAQISYYSSLIQGTTGWTYAGVYYDEAFTGTKESNRKGFNQLINDAKAGKIDIIITKSVSRFARNTVTLLSITRELKAINVDVFFEEQNLHTISAQGELLLTLLASYAQEESRSVSENCRWRVKKNFTEGKMYGNKTIFGYKLVDNKYELVPDQAEVVKWIFETYLQGSGAFRIANQLNEKGIKFLTGRDWREADVRRLLKNISYTGDLILQKTFVTDYLTKTKKENNGEKDKYYVADDHEPIVSRDTFKEAQRLLSIGKEKWYKGTAKKQYAFTGKLVCTNCGCSLIHKVSKYHDYWLCSTTDKLGISSCHSFQLREDVLKEKICEALGINEFDEALFNKKINWIDSTIDRVLIFHFKDGTEKSIPWEVVSRSKSWTPEMKEKARQKRYEQEAMKNGKNNSNTKHD